MNASSLLGRRIDGVMFSPTGRLVGLLLDDGSASRSIARRFWKRKR